MSQGATDTAPSVDIDKLAEYVAEIVVQKLGTDPPPKKKEMFSQDDRIAMIIAGGLVLMGATAAFVFKKA